MPTDAQSGSDERRLPPGDRMARIAVAPMRRIGEDRAVIDGGARQWMM
jgi:hypothetical protein